VKKAAPAKVPAMPPAPMMPEPMRQEPGMGTGRTGGMTGMGGMGEAGGMGRADDYAAGPLWPSSEDEEG